MTIKRNEIKRWIATFGELKKTEKKNIPLIQG